MIPGADAVAQLARNLIEARKHYGLTQEQVSDRSGVHPTEISRIENGQRDIQVSTIFKLAKAFDLTPGQFIDGAPNDDDRPGVTVSTGQRR
jgi:transcriptional regulator with XRE-family HTH domain